MVSKVSYGRRQGACDDPIQSGYSFLDDFDSKQIADAMVCSQGIARNKLNPECDSNHQTLAEAVALSVHFEDDRQLAAWATKRGKALVDIPQNCVCEEELADQILLVNEVLGILNAEIREARADGVIDPQERQKIKAAALNAIRTVLTLDEAINSQVREFPTKNK